MLLGLVLAWVLQTWSWSCRIYKTTINPVRHSAHHFHTYTYYFVGWELEWTKSNFENFYKTFFLQNARTPLGPIVFLIVYLLKLIVINVLCRLKKINGSENFELQFLKIRICGLISLQFSADDLRIWASDTNKDPCSMNCFAFHFNLTLQINAWFLLNIFLKKISQFYKLQMQLVL